MSIHSDLPFTILDLLFRKVNDQMKVYLVMLEQVDETERYLLGVAMLHDHQFVRCLKTKYFCTINRSSSSAYIR